MPYKPKRPCSYPGCPRLTDGRYCEEHQKIVTAHYNKYGRDPASRRSYTFSAQIASEDLQKGPAGQVGIEVTFEYEDGSTETRFIDLF